MENWDAELMHIIRRAVNFAMDEADMETAFHLAQAILQMQDEKRHVPADLRSYAWAITTIEQSQKGNLASAKNRKDLRSCSLSGRSRIDAATIVINLSKDT